jgi:hypothetical protein
MREGVLIIYVIIYLYDELSTSSDPYLYLYHHIYPHHVSTISDISISSYDFYFPPCALPHMCAFSFTKLFRPLVYL